ncbi:bifunctional DNA primase/polymerase [Micromonospora mirobrigensis]|uniref:Bifunctional DNA primase/polymerase, N-terminal n=1 Tax=Micromonospora mirobrigensis TaxID=262898 RepID=A0A1C4ZLM3_9ACTN|nr:bifunctional DNA primase/polymerase [Micromonospora mirobrigensis]SCF34007.1 Bifunctional DNA primase/polymerase, N-terminal [Micromonospora mirobrigensis]
MSDLLAAALAHAARGWHIFPLRPDDKRPAFPDHTADDCVGRDPRCRDGHVGWEQRATTDPDRIRRAWSRRPYGVGVACGPSGLVVVDLDVPKHLGDTPPPEWAGVCDGWGVFAALAARHGTPLDPFDGFGPDAGPRTGIDATYTVGTGSGGTHLYYRHPTSGPALRNTTGDRGGLGWKVDTRAHGGYVVAAGSTVAGRPYAVALDYEPAPLPGWLAGLLTPALRPARRAAAVTLPADRHGRYVAAAIRRQVAHLAAATEGQRNHALFASAVALGQLAAGGALTDDDVTAVLEPVALSVGLRPGEVARTIASGLRVGARQPRYLADLGRVA